MRWLFLTTVLAACSNTSQPSGSPDDAGTDASAPGDVADSTAPCLAPKTSCARGCVDVSSDPTNCGSCGFACGSGQSCCAGACSTDCSMSVQSLSPAQGPMSGGAWVTVKGKGFAAGAKVFLGKSRAPARVVDPQTILVLTPVGLAGDVDVRVQQSSSVSTKGNAFRYRAYGFEGPWKRINMSAPRGNQPGISVMQDRRVLITGGVANSSGGSQQDSADVYDPATATATATAGKMSAARWTQAQMTLLTGKTLVLGTWFGAPGAVTGPLADLFDGASGTFTPTSSKPSVEHRWPHAAMLADGRVIIVSYDTAAPDLYDPATDSFAPLAGAPNTTSYRPARLLDGRIVLVEGSHGIVHIFDPDLGTWSDAGPGPTANDGDVFTLPDGRVLYVAGRVGEQPTDLVEVFDPTKTTGFSPTPYHLAQARNWQTTALLGDGSILVIGGNLSVAPNDCAAAGWAPTSAVERIDPVAGTVVPFDALPDKNFVMTAATMQDGSVVSAGGASCGGGNAYPYFYFLQGKPPPK